MDSSPYGIIETTSALHLARSKPANVKLYAPGSSQTKRASQSLMTQSHYCGRVMFNIAFWFVT